MTGKFGLVGDWSSGTLDIDATVKIGAYCIAEPYVSIGPETVVRSFVELRSGTKIGAGCYIDSYVVTSGDCIIGNRVRLRYGAIIARGCEIGDGTFLAPRVMTENLNHHGVAIGGAKIGARCFIGTHTVLAAGISICDDVVIGSNSYVRDSITKPGIYYWPRPDVVHRGMTGSGDGI